ncbi:DNA topoisomerase 2-binding protein 1 [Chamberlinius hualienensis]
MPHQVKFVKESDNISLFGELSEDMDGAFKISSKSDDVSWITFEEICKLTNAASAVVFVCDRFEGKSFEELKKRKLRIYGPRYILYCYQKRELVDRLSYPAFTATMKGLVVCCTNVQIEKRLRLYDKVKLMGGQITKAFTEETTHLVADQASSKKYHLAAALQKPIYTSEWINRCWQDGKSSLNHATDPCYDKYRCPIFKGLSITVSQISSSERAKIKDIIEKNDGHYAGCLKVNVTTHLILTDCSGDKFKMAKSKNIYCLRPTWVYDSIKKGYCADEHHYSLGENSLTSESSFRNDRSTTLGLSSNSINTMSETALGASKMEKTALETEQLHIDPVKLEVAGQFLDGCKIVLSGFSPIMLDKLKKILNIGGATRFDQINEDVTHVIMGRLSDEHRKTLLEGHFRPHVVSLAWLKESVNSGKTIDENPFYCLDLPVIKQISPFKTQFRSKPRLDSTLVQHSNSQKGFELEPPSTSEDIGDVLSQYLPAEVTEVQSTVLMIIFDL